MLRYPEIRSATFLSLIRQSSVVLPNALRLDVQVYRVPHSTA